MDPKSGTRHQGKEDEEKEGMEYEQFLSSAGEFGLYQLLLILKTSPFYIFGSFVYTSQIFMTEVPKNFWCRIPELENLTIDARKALAIPEDIDAPFGFAQCTSYAANWTEVLQTGNKPDLTWVTEKCQYGYEYDLTEIPYPTIGTEHGWVCEKNSYQATAQSLFFAGSIIGGFLVGWVADRFGRVPAIVVANIIGCVAGISSTFTTNFIQFTISRIFMGMSYDNCMMLAFILMLEYTAPKYRTRLANITMAIFMTIGTVAVPWISLACADWRVISIATSVPLAMSVFTPFVLPESTQWLIIKGRIDDVVKNVKNIAKTNKKDIPERLVARFKLSCSKNNKVKCVNIIELLKRSKLRLMFICICLEYFFCMIIFETLVRTIGSLKYDFFVSFSVISFMVFPSLVLLSFILDLTGRKWLSITCLFICASFSFVTPFVGGGLPSVLCAVCARFTCNMACNSILQWSAELLPTPVRGTSTSIIHICGYVAMIVSPFIAYLDNYVSWLPMVVVGGIALFSASICFYLPETAGKEMPQTFEEVETIIRNKTLWDMPCMQKKEQRNENLGYNNDTFEMN